MQGYVNIAEASKITGKHKDTIRRLVRSNKGSSNIVTGRKKEYLISRQWLNDYYDLQPSPTEAPQQADNSPVDKEPSPEPTTQINSLYEALADQLKAKDKQIEQLQQIILEKEANTTKLQDQFQHLLATKQLPADTSNYAINNQPTPEVEVIKTSNKQKAKKQQPNKKKKTKVELTTKEPKPAKKQRWWQR